MLDCEHDKSAHLRCKLDYKVCSNLSSDNGNDILVPGETLGVDDVEDAGSVQLTVAHENLLQLSVGYVDESTLSSTRGLVQDHEHGI